MIPAGAEIYPPIPVREDSVSSFQVGRHGRIYRRCVGRPTSNSMKWHQILSSSCTYEVNLTLLVSAAFSACLSLLIITSDPDIAGTALRKIQKSPCHFFLNTLAALLGKASRA